MNTRVAELERHCAHTLMFCFAAAAEITLLLIFRRHYCRRKDTLLRMSCERLMALALRVSYVDAR